MNIHFWASDVPIWLSCKSNPSGQLAAGLPLGWVHICANSMQFLPHPIHMIGQCDRFSVESVHTGRGRPQTRFQKGPVHFLIWFKSKFGPESHLNWGTETHRTPGTKPLPHICGRRLALALPSHWQTRATSRCIRRQVEKLNKAGIGFDRLSAMVTLKRWPD